MNELPHSIRRIYTMLLSRKVRFFLEATVRGYYPRIYDRKKFIFIHIPKTAGKSLREVLGTGGACHLSYHHYKKIIGTKINDYFIFSVIRDPLDRLASSYAYLSQGGNQSTDDLILKQRWVDSTSSFDDFVKHSLTQPEVYKLRKFRPQVSFLVDEEGQINNITLLRFEQLNHDFKKIAHQLNISSDLPHINASNRKTHNYSLSRESIEILCSLYNKDYIQLGYSKPDNKH